MKKISILFIFLFTFFCSISCENVARTFQNPELYTQYWPASWISLSNEKIKCYGIYHFRKSFEIQSVPEHFTIHVSADCRYRLFINGIAVCFGPARSDLRNWNYETLDIAPFLITGKNLLAAVVWNFGDENPGAQISLRTAFILQGNTDKENVVNTNNTWKIFKNNAYQPLNPRLYDYITVGPGEIIDAENYPWNWEKIGFDDSQWKNAVEICKGRPKGFNTGEEWELVPRDIPFLEQSEQRFKSIRKAENLKPDPEFLSGRKSFTIPANTTTVLLIDQGTETVAYPEITVSASPKSEIEITYSEALYDAKGIKGNRNDVNGKIIRGITDIYKVGNESIQTFRPLWFRTFRYVQLTVRTKNNPLTIKDLKSEFTVYPFKKNATFHCSNPELEKIWEVGWRTLRLCSNETHYDCPFYEQLQYVGDTRIQCLISAYVSGDDRLTRKAITSFDNSRTSEGLTYSRYPSAEIQVIPPFSLFWINMIHDYWMLHNDNAFVKPLLFGIKNVLHWYENRLDAETDMLGKTSYWNFVDWPDQWAWSFETLSGGEPRGACKGGSSILSFQFAYALNEAADLFEYFGQKAESKNYRNLSKNITKKTVSLCWDYKRNLISDTPEKKEYSQHANIMAVMANAELPIQNAKLIEDILFDTTLIQASVYYRFYMSQAMKRVGLADKYLQTIDPWKKMIDNGLTTFSERLDPTRSDCHAWSASPTYELLATVCGIQPNEPGFKSVLITPHLGNLKWIEGSVPHILGVINVRFEKNIAGSLKGEIYLPIGLRGVYRYNGRSVKLHEGFNKILY